MSFYITLPSTSSMDIFPDNTTSNYTTLLQSPLKLDGSWQVALIGFTYRLNISMYIGSVKLYQLDQGICPNCWNFKQKVDIEAYEGEKYSELITRMNQLFSKLNLDISFNSSDDDHLLKVILPHNYMIMLDGRIPDLLHLNTKQRYEYSGAEILSTNYNANAKIYHNEFFFFYTDIIRDQYVGDTKAKLLETIAISGNREKTVSVDISNPNYVDVGLTEISSINITIKNSIGENIHFDHFSRVIIKLHFRPKRYE